MIITRAFNFVRLGKLQVEVQMRQLSHAIKIKTQLEQLKPNAKKEYYNTNVSLSSYKQHLNLGPQMKQSVYSCSLYCYDIEYY